MRVPIKTVAMELERDVTLELAALTIRSVVFGGVEDAPAVTNGLAEAGSCTVYAREGQYQLRQKLRHALDEAAMRDEQFKVPIKENALEIPMAELMTPVFQRVATLLYFELEATTLDKEELRRQLSSKTGMECKSVVRELRAEGRRLLQVAIAFKNTSSFPMVLIGTQLQGSSLSLTFEGAGNQDVSVHRKYIAVGIPPPPLQLDIDLFKSNEGVWELVGTLVGDEERKSLTAQSFFYTDFQRQRFLEMFKIMKED